MTTASRQRTPSLGPAAIVIAIAALIVTGGAAVALLGSASAQAPTPQLGTNVPGVPIRAIPAAGDLRYVEAAGEPPPDVVKALTVPASSRYLGRFDGDANAGQFSRSVKFSVPASMGTVDHFYAKELTAARWLVQFDGRANGNTELIGQRSGSDGYQWRVAIVISAINPTFTPALAGSTQTATSSVIMTVFQVQDAA